MRALPVAADTNEVGHYCQAQPQFQLSWAELALVLIYPAARPPVRNSSEIAGIEQNLLSKSCKSILLDLKTIKEILKRWKTTSMERGRHHQ